MSPAFGASVFCGNPLIASMGRAAAIARKMHVGHVNAYAANVLLVLLVLLTMLCVLIVGAVLF
jgi:hypothetical protein